MQDWNNDPYSQQKVGDTTLSLFEAMLKSLRSNFSGATQPSNPTPGMWWFDTTSNILKLRNEANSAWLSVYNFSSGKSISALTADSATNADTTDNFHIYASGSPVANHALTLDGTGKFPESVVPSTGARWVYLDRQTASTSPILEFASYINSTYDRYLFIMDRLKPASDNSYLVSQVGDGTGYYTASGYTYALHGMKLGASPVEILKGATSAAQLLLSDSDYTFDSDNVRLVLNGELQMLYPSSTTVHTEFTGRLSWPDQNDEDQIVFNDVVARFQNGSDATPPAITKIKFYFPSGNITSGTITMYGWDDGS